MVKSTDLGRLQTGTQTVGCLLSLIARVWVGIIGLNPS
jgi:hypothetical protein